MSTPDYVNITIKLHPEVQPDAEGGKRFWADLEAAGLGYGDYGDDKTFEPYPSDFRVPEVIDTYAATMHTGLYGTDVVGFCERTSALSEVLQVSISVEYGEEQGQYDETYQDGARVLRRDTAMVPSTLDEVRKQIEAVADAVDRLDVPSSSLDILAVLHALRAARETMQEIDAL